MHPENGIRTRRITQQPLLVVKCFTTFREELDGDVSGLVSHDIET